MEGGEGVLRCPPSARLHRRTGRGRSDPARLHGRTGRDEGREIFVMVGRKREGRGGKKDLRVCSDATRGASLADSGVLRVAARLNWRTGGDRPPEAA